MKCDTVIKLIFETCCSNIESNIVKEKSTLRVLFLSGLGGSIRSANYALWSPSALTAV